MAVMHLPTMFGADIFIQSGVIDIFPKSKMAALGFPSYVNLSHSSVLTVQCVSSVRSLVQISVSFPGL